MYTQTLADPGANPTRFRGSAHLVAQNVKIDGGKPHMRPFFTLHWAYEG